MIEIVGKFNTAKVYTDILEDAAYKQILNLMNQKFAEGSHFAIMPDCHAGTGCVIGLTMKIVDRVVPNLVGVDIGCGMLVMKVSKDCILDLPKFDKVCHIEIPSGMNHRTKKHRFTDRVALDELIAPVNAEKLMLSIGSLGSGNHFIEIDVDEAGDRYIVIHSGSRHLGIEVCNFYQKEAIKYHKNQRQTQQEIIERLKAQGRQSEIETVLKANQAAKCPIPDELAYLEGELLQNYLHDMKIAQEFAWWNREAMMDVIIDCMGIKKHHILDKFCTVHNYIDLDNMILRKGSISLQKDEVALIPMNMRDGSLLVRGKGNEEWNFSGPHGAGRLMSRSKAKETLTMEAFKSSMEGIYTTCVGSGTIDESPMAYKPMDEIVRNIQETADIITTIKPIYNFKASEEKAKGNK